ncbi:MAG: hypothetical protein RL153_2282, partial [Verrucomicrobiota bacterium]
MNARRLVGPPKASGLSPYRLAAATQAHNASPYTRYKGVFGFIGGSRGSLGWSFRFDR